MNEPGPAVHTTLRIPGNWAHPGELIERMPAGFRLTPEVLEFPDGTQVEFQPMPPDEQFPGIFESACRRPATPAELEIARNYTVNVVLYGPGGSMEDAVTMLQAGAAIVRAGGAGVFIDNCGLAHGGIHWVEMAEDAGIEAVSFAFTSIVRGPTDVWTMGMHVMGLPDVVVRQSDVDADCEMLIEVIRYLCEGNKPIGDGHILADESGPRFQAKATAFDEFEGSPMHNPYGRLSLVSMRKIAEDN